MLGRSKGEQEMNKTLLALDPGTTQTGYIFYGESRPFKCGVADNHAVLEMVKMHDGPIACEMIASYGMAVGKEVFETCVWIGRFQQAYFDTNNFNLVYRREVKIHLCGSVKAKDANIRQAILDLFPSSGGGSTPQVGTKSNPGPLFGVSSHVWPALGVALTYMKVR
jgi:hypothetical protein